MSQPLIPAWMISPWPSSEQKRYPSHIVVCNTFCFATFPESFGTNWLSFGKFGLTDQTHSPRKS